MAATRSAFIASTGRTATMFLAAALDALPDVRGLHEGHSVGDPPTPVLPVINVQNRQAWESSDTARRVVAERRDQVTLAAVADGQLLVDVAFYNAPFLPALGDAHPDASLLAVFRRCEGFVRSATIVEGEDRQPAGWPDPNKPLTDRERFIELGRLRPQAGDPESDRWPSWSGVQRNIWLWHTVNRHLLDTVESRPRAAGLHFERLVSEPRRFWADCLSHLGIDTAHAEVCVARSTDRLNARSRYHVGPISSWSVAERDLYHALAEPLERQLYE